MLGRGKWVVQITGRGGSPVRFQIAHEQFSFSRILNSSASSSLTMPLSGSQPSCGEVLVATDPWAEEVVFYRDGELAYCGPMQEPEVGEAASFPSRDLFAWMDKRFIDDDLTFHQDTAEVFEKIVMYALDKDPSPNITVKTKPVGERSIRSYAGKAFGKCSSALTELTSTGLNFTTIGRTIYAGDLGSLLPSNPLLLHDKGVSKCGVKKLGAGLANDIAVIGEIPENERFQVSGRATRSVGRFGLLQESIVDLKVKDRSDCITVAEAIIDSNIPVPLMLTVTLTSDADMDFEELIPGRTVRSLLSTDLTYGVNTFGDYLLREVPVRVSAGKEEISLVLVPLGREDD